MSGSLTFLGAARNVTGSRYLLETGGVRILVDCGLHQERSFRSRDWEPFAVAPDRIDAVLLTHAHLDHCGYLPRLVADGFSGPVFCTAVTAEIAAIVLRDAAHIMAEDAKFKQRRHEREGRNVPREVKPLYTAEDVERALPRIEPVGFGKRLTVAKGISATWREAGHIFGSASILIETASSGSILFSGDIGRWDKPILRDPDSFESADFVVIESTYGDREHEDRSDSLELLVEAVTIASDRGGNLVIPAFAIGRTQELLYRLNQLLVDDRIPHLATFIDSPMAIRVTEVFRAHPELFDAEMRELIEDHHSPFAMPNLNLSTSAGESKAINHIRGTVIVIAGSGMCTGGRIKHHLVQNLGRPESVILFVGYQAGGTLGREISSGRSPVRIFGAQHAVKAKVIQLNGFSAHADRSELDRWFDLLARKPKRIFVTHGESEVAASYAQLLAKRTGIPTIAPEYLDTLKLA